MVRLFFIFLDYHLFTNPNNSTLFVALKSILVTNKTRPYLLMKGEDIFTSKMCIMTVRKRCRKICWRFCLWHVIDIAISKLLLTSTSGIFIYENVPKLIRSLYDRGNINISLMYFTYLVKSSSYQIIFEFMR